APIRTLTLLFCTLVAAVGAFSADIGGQIAGAAGLAVIAGIWACWFYTGRRTPGGDSEQA
ncbi:MAG: hypothetical protein AAF790_15720, partial [Planctomycetota bacterium]